MLTNKLLPLLLVFTLAGISLSAEAAVQKKKGGKKNPVVAAEPVVAPTGAGSGEVADAAARLAWSIDAQPFRTIGSGHPGKNASDIDKPDGAAFTPTGLLLATDAKNRRVHVWDVRTGERIGDFGTKYFGGEIVDIAVGPDGLVLVTDQTLNLAYAFTPPAPGAVGKTGQPASRADYQFAGTRFGEQGFDKLGGIYIDARRRVYCVDAHLDEVRRFTPDFQVDSTFHFQKTRPNGDTYLHGCEGIAINESTGDMFIASEKDNIVQVFDAETGAYRGRLVGAGVGPTGDPTGTKVFSGSVEGLAIAKNHLFAVDESAGRVQIFDLNVRTVYNTDLVKFSTPKVNRHRGYLGYVGHTALVDFEDKTNLELQQKVKDGAIIPGQANPPGYLCSPDSITAYTDPADGETFIVVCDQCNYRLAVYRLSDILHTQAVLAVDDGHKAAPGSKGHGKTGKKGKKANN